MKLLKNANFLAFLLIVATSLIALKSLSTNGYYTSHDGETHTARIAQYYLALKDGQLPPQFAGSFYYYLGSPIFIYIYPMPYISGSILHILGFSFANSFKLLMALSFIFSQVFTYVWLKRLFKDNKAALIGALFYGWVPYRFLLIYVRASISEMLAYTFLPLAFYFLTELSESKKLSTLVFAAFSFALVFLSQDLVALISLPILASYTLIIGLYKKSFSYLVKSFIVVFWGFALSAFTYFPALFERNLIRFNSAFNNAFGDHFVCPSQLIHSPWGYGFDFPGCLKDGMSFQMGLTQLLIIAIYAALLVYLVYRHFKSKKKKGTNFDITKLTLPLSVFFLMVITVSVILMTNFSVTALIWEKVKSLQIIDIPWRFLGLVALGCAFLAAFVLSRIKSSSLFVFLVIALVIANRNIIRINKPIYYSDEHFLNFKESATEREEFMPNFGAHVTDFKNRINVLAGQADVSNIFNNSKKTIANISVSSSEATIRINRYYFPVVQILDNGRPLSQDNIKSFIDSKKFDPVLTKESNGLINIKISQGKHQIGMTYGKTPIRLLGEYISLISLILALVLLIKYAKI